MKYLIIKCTEGFGDRLQVLLQALDYCKKTGRILIPDWNDYMWGDGFTTFEYYFKLKGINNMKLKHFKENYKKNMSIIPKVWEDQLFKPADLRIYNSEYLLKDEDRIINDICSEKVIDFPHDIVVLTGIKNRTFIYKNIVHLELSNRLINKIKQCDIYRSLSKIKYIAVHLRGGDRIGHSDKRFDNGSINSTKYIQDILSQTLKYSKDTKNKNILILSDTQHLIEMFKDKIDNKKFNLYETNNILLNKDNIKLGLHKIPYKIRSKKKITKKKINFFTLLDFCLLLNSEHVINDNHSIFSNITKNIKLNSKKPYFNLHQNLQTININLHKINNINFHLDLNEFKDLFIYEGSNGQIFINPNVNTKNDYYFYISYVSNEYRPLILKINNNIKKITTHVTNSFSDLFTLTTEKHGPYRLNEKSIISLKSKKYFPHIFKIWLEKEIII